MSEFRKIVKELLDKIMPSAEDVLIGPANMVFVNLAKEKALNEIVSAHDKEVEEAVKSVEDKFPTDVFSEPTKADFDKINDFDPDLNTRLHCFGIRKGLKLLRRELAEDKLND